MRAKTARQLLRCALIGVILCGTSLKVRAQEDPGPPPPPPGREGGRGPREGGPPPPPPGPTPEQRLTIQLQLMLGSGDDEWAVLEPRISQIQKLIAERERFTKPRPPKPPRDPNRGGPEPRDEGPATIVDLKSDPKKDAAPHTINGDLLLVYTNLVMLASTGAPDAAMANELVKYRQALAASNAQLAKTRTELRELVTARQEIVLIVTGILD